jgi:hypothetical protein
VYSPGVMLMPKLFPAQTAALQPGDLLDTAWGNLRASPGKC